MTLTELYTARVEKLEHKIDSLKSDIDSTRSDKNDQDQALQFWINRIVSRDAELQEAENAISTTSTIAEIEAIASSMRELRIDRRASQAKMNLTQKSLSTSEFTLRHLVKTLDELNGQLSETKAELDEATQQDEKHQVWIDSVALDPLASVPTEADALLTNSIDPALDKLKAITSEAFVDRLSERLAHHWGELDDLEDRTNDLTLINDSMTALQSGREGELDTKLRLFDAAVSNLGKFVANSQAILDSALATANRIQESALLNTVQKAHFDSLLAEGDIEVDVLTPESELRVAEHQLLIRIRELETARAIARAADPDIEDSDLDDVVEVKAIIDGTDGKDDIATMQSNYDDALDAIGVSTFDTLIEKETALQAANDALQTAIEAFIEENPDQDPDAAPELDGARDAVSDAEAELSGAQTSMNDSPWYKLEQLEVAIPSETWVDALYLLNAQRQLNDLKSIDPNDLASAVTSAGNELATTVDSQIDTDEGISISQKLMNQYQGKFKNITTKGTEAALNVALGVL